MTTVSNGDRKDTDMKLLLIFAAILAFSLAEVEKKSEVIDDSQAEASASIELLKEGADLNAAASSYPYVPPSQRPPHWNAPDYVPPQNTWKPPKPIQPVQTGVPANVQSDYYDPNHHWNVPTSYPPTTATPVSVIKNEQYFGENGYYRYEYHLTDGTWVGEEGYYTDPRQTEESLVKKGWYSYVGADKKTYTVSYWSDHTGYHAYGDHLPSSPVATKAAIDKENQQPQHDYPTQTPVPVFYPTQTPAPAHYPTSGPYVAPQQPAYVHPKQPAYVHPKQPAYETPQVPNYHSPQQPSNPSQQQYYPTQQNW